MRLRTALCLGLLLPIINSGCSHAKTRFKSGFECSDIELGEGVDTDWGALSGLSADPEQAQIFYSVHDRNLDGAHIYVIDAQQKPATITRVITLHDSPNGYRYDPEGIAKREGKGFWVVSEGKKNQSDPNLLLRVGAHGKIKKEIPLPDSVQQYKTKSGLEGVAVFGHGADEQVLVIFQRPWQDDPVAMLKIGEYLPQTDTWRFFHYPLDSKKGVGLSAITPAGNGRFFVLERDNHSLTKAHIKRVYAFTLPDTTDSETLPVIEKTLVLDLLQNLNPWLCINSGKLEGMAVNATGQLYLVNDDDGAGDGRLLKLKQWPTPPPGMAQGNLQWSVRRPADRESR